MYYMTSIRCIFLIVAKLRAREYSTILYILVVVQGSSLSNRLDTFFEQNDNYLVQRAILKPRAFHTNHILEGCGSYL